MTSLFAGIDCAIEAVMMLDAACCDRFGFHLGITHNLMASWIAEVTRCCCTQCRVSFSSMFNVQVRLRRSSAVASCIESLTVLSEELEFPGSLGFGGFGGFLKDNRLQCSMCI